MAKHNDCNKGYRPIFANGCLMREPLGLRTQIRRIGKQYVKKIRGLNEEQKRMRCEELCNSVHAYIWQIGYSNKPITNENMNHLFMFIRGLLTYDEFAVYFPEAKNG